MKLKKELLFHFYAIGAAAFQTVPLEKSQLPKHIKCISKFLLTSQKLIQCFYTKFELIYA